MLEEGARLYERGRQGAAEARRQGSARPRVTGARRRPARRRRATPASGWPRRSTATSSRCSTQHPLRQLVTAVRRARQVWVDRQRALYGAWYEFFPRSEGAAPDADGVLRTGTFRTAMERLPAVAEMGFDVVYLPPIHPIGKVNRKGPNSPEFPGGNPHDIGPHDPGSPWAIGSDEGGHDAVHPDLGTLEDFDAFVARAGELGMEVALDLALQCAPDHPWAQEHPEWFTTRADGTIAYAENPPKKYQDIYPLNFDNDPEGIYAEVLRVVRHWTSHGVRIFRVDNPHTKPLAFWEWLIAEVKATEPDVLFLAEAFTRPAMMHELARIGFTQSYTYFTWRTGKTELQEYVAGAGRGRPTTCGRTSSSTRPTSCTRRCSTAGRRSSRSGPSSPRCCRRPTASTPATSCTSTSRSSRAARSTWTPRSTPYRPRDWSQPGAHAGAVPHDAQPVPPRAPGAAVAAQHALPRRRLPRRHGVEQAGTATTATTRPRRRQPRPARRPRGDRAPRPAGARLRLGRPHRGAPTRSPARPTTGARTTTCASTRSTEPAHVFTVRRAARP